ncbi:hypothetical protein [Thermoplasma volcanium]|uniref:hypothetical protein n=1 Tax=Thermoplasma volcanium TaxID=50339 RepID=UPI00138A0480|nr:hypothetical protein [Thermoplasma volcanium]
MSDEIQFDKIPAKVMVKSKLSKSRQQYFGFIGEEGATYIKEYLEERGLMNRKGFPESYDLKALIKFPYELKSGKENIDIPQYSHIIYDIVPGKFKTVENPDVLILEGLNVLQTRRTDTIPPASELLVSDFLDFSI